MRGIERVQRKRGAGVRQPGVDPATRLLGRKDVGHRRQLDQVQAILLAAGPHVCVAKEIVCHLATRLQHIEAALAAALGREVEAGIWDGNSYGMKKGVL